MQRREIMQVLEELRPFEVDGMHKTRIGRNADGGYVMLEDFAATGAVYSFGIGSDVSFDLDFAALGIPVFQYDHTVEAPSDPHGRFTFERKGLAASPDGTDTFRTLQQFLAGNGHADRRDLLLKMDIDGAELDVLCATDADTLSSFRQIVLEVHWLSRIADPDYRTRLGEALRKLNSAFTLCHVHGNNCAGLHFVDGLAVCDVLELTYVRSDLVTRKPSQTVYPTMLDFANHPGAPDHLLWFFPFIPTADSEDAVEAFRYSFRHGARRELMNERVWMEAHLANLRSEAERLAKRIAVLDTTEPF
jgi:hypothetical protein